MTKVVYNACFGGFNISREAVLKGRELSDNPKWGGKISGDDDYPINDPFWSRGDYVIGDDDIPRHDKILVQVVEALGDKASGFCAKLRICEIEGRQYRIDEYDGNETVVKPLDQSWVIVDY